MQYNGSFRKDSGLPVGSALIHDPPEQFWSRDAFQKVDNNKKKREKRTKPSLRILQMHFYGLQLDGETFHPEFWHIHVADLPLTVFPTGVSEAPCFGSHRFKLLRKQQKQKTEKNRKPLRAELQLRTLA